MPPAVLAELIRSADIRKVMKKALVRLFMIMIGLSLCAKGDAQYERLLKARHDALSSLPAVVRSAWKKYGEFDYKMADPIYESFTQFNFGAVGTKLGLGREDLFALRKMFLPNEADLKSLVSEHCESKFSDRKEGLEQLLRMFQSDPALDRIGPEIELPVAKSPTLPPISSKRREDYIALLRRNGIDEGIVRVKTLQNGAKFVVKAIGLCIAGSGCGYVKSDEKLKCETDTPESVIKAISKDKDSSGATIYYDLGDGWYAFYELDW